MDDPHTWSARKSSLSTAVEQIQLLGRYQWEARLGSGSFGEVYRCLDTETNTLIAVKVEKKKGKSAQLLTEVDVLKLMSPFHGFPRLLFYHEDEDQRYLGMTLLGDSLEDQFRRRRSLFTFKHVLRVGMDLVARLRDLHAVGYISRDVKSENIMEDNFLIDFGLAKLYRDPKSHKHIPVKVKNTLTGTARYASLNAHRGLELSRRDDLESLGYVLLYLLRGTLPWQGLRTDADNTDKYQMIFDVKRKVDVNFICRDLPEEISFLILYARALDFDEEPDYAMLIEKFRLAWERQPVLDLLRGRERNKSVPNAPAHLPGAIRRMSMPATLQRPAVEATAGRDDTMAAMSSRRVEGDDELSVKSRPLENIVETSSVDQPTNRLVACFQGIFRCGRIPL